MNPRIDGPDGAAANLILAHGAGAGIDTPFFDTLSTALVEQGVRVIRFEFPYMSRRRATGKKLAPDRAPVLLDAYRAAVAAQRDARPLYVGGKSMGGRIASMLADELGVAGLICFGYPFHPPGRPDRLRVAHLKTLATPALILQGTRDPFGGLDEVPGYGLSPAIRIEWLEDGDHGFYPRKSSGFSQVEHWHAAAERAASFIHGRPD